MTRLNDILSLVNSGILFAVVGLVLVLTGTGDGWFLIAAGAVFVLIGVSPGQKERRARRRRE